MLSKNDLITFIPTSNEAKAREFYVDKLGLKFIADTPFALVLSANGIMVRIAKTKDFVPAPFTILGWHVENIAEQVQELRGCGVEFCSFDFLDQDDLQIWKSPDGAKIAWFKDFDGNMLSLTQFP